MSPVTLERDGDVFVLTLDDGENRFRVETVTALGAALDEIEATEGPAALVTIGTGKFYSNGLDLEWLGSHGDQAAEYLASVYRILGRILGADFPTVAAINGHAFAGGAMLAMAHDVRVMREDRGFFCIPEIDLRFPLDGPFLELLRATLPARSFHELLLTGERIGGVAALDAGVVQQAVPEDQVLERARERAAALAGKDRATYGAIKRAMYGPVIACLTGAE